MVPSDAEERTARSHNHFAQVLGHIAHRLIGDPCPDTFLVAMQSLGREEPESVARDDQAADRS